MKTIGPVTFMIGLGQAIFQFYLLFTGGYWSRFTIADFLAEFGYYRGYGMTWWDGVCSLVLGLEFSLTLLFLGTLLVVSGPIWQVFQAWHADKLVLEATRRPHPLLERRMH